MTLSTDVDVRRLMIAALLTLAPGVARTATANVLEASAAKALITDRTWQQQQAHGPGKLYWTWKSDGSACLRIDDGQGKCTDTGKWKLEGNRMCYELTWWGATVGRKSACFRITDKGKNQFEAVQDNGLPLFEFSVPQ